MQINFILICAVASCAVAQRGHYAGSGRPILGLRYQNLESAAASTQSNINTQAAPVQSNTPSQVSNNIVPPIQGSVGNRFVPNANRVNPNQINSNQIGNNLPDRNQFGEFGGEYGGFGGGFPYHGGFPGFGFPPHGQFGQRGFHHR